VLSRNVTGVSVDWEYSYGNNQTCFVALWAHVAAVLAPHGRKFAPWVDNGGGWQSGPGDADAEWDYRSYLPFAAKLINMGSYEATGDAYPNKNRSLVALPCTSVPGGDPATVNPVGWWCGLEGTIVDFLKHGARPDQVGLSRIFVVSEIEIPNMLVNLLRSGRAVVQSDNTTESYDQILPALWMTPCCSGPTPAADICKGIHPQDGTMTTTGWTQGVLRDFLKFVAASEIDTVAVWTNGAMSAGPSAPSGAAGNAGLSTCPWFINELRAFVLGEEKGPCTDYFGSSVDSTGTSGTLWTVVDVDVHDGFPFGKETFVHHAGPHSRCIPPGPPAGCHRYYVAQYDSQRCDPVSCPLANGNAAALAGTLDTAGAFDRAAGVLKGCFACVKSVEVSCWGAPTDAPVACACPGQYATKSL
jgi:hypothetical protein